MCDISYTTRLSSAQMAEESKRATAEGMRQIAEAMNIKALNTVTSESGSDSDFESDTFSESSNSRCRRRKHKSKPTDFKTNDDKLETRIHYMTLELANTKVEVDDAKTALEGVQKQLQPYNRVNDELAFLKSAMNRAFKDTGNLNKVQLVNKHKLFTEETSDHATMCAGQISRIEHEEIKIALLRILDAEKRKIAKLDTNYRSLILKAQIKETLMVIGIWLSVLIVSNAIIYQVVLTFN
jgi:hypothetical protein